MARYRKLDIRMWSDSKFRELSPIPPCGQGLWIYLLTSPYTSNIPGVYRASEGALADDLRWPLKAFRKAFLEASQKDMVKADWNAPLVFVKNALRYNRPESPNVITSWRSTWDEIPECSLKVTVYQHLKAFAEGLPKAFLEAFTKALPEGSLGVRARAPGDPSPNQEQEQEQEQEQDQERVRADARSPVCELCASLVAYMNIAGGTSFPTRGANLGMLHSRHGEYGAEACRRVIRVTAEMWIYRPRRNGRTDDKDMRPFFRPETIFRPTKFPGYLGQRDPGDPRADQWGRLPEGALPLPQETAS